MDNLVKQIFNEFRENETHIVRLNVTIRKNNSIEISANFQHKEDYNKYTSLFLQLSQPSTNENNNMFTIKFKNENELTTFISDVKEITPNWIMQNLPPNVDVMDYHRQNVEVYPLDKLPRKLNTLIITELEVGSDITNLPNGLEKLNLYNCIHVVYNYKKIPSSLKLLILAEDIPESVTNYRINVHFGCNFLATNIETVCYGKLKMNKTKSENFFLHDYYKYNRTFDNSKNILDAFLSNLMFNRKKYFKRNYEYNENGWFHLAC